MIKVCKKCNKSYDESYKKCPVCGKKLETQYTKEELEQIKKENEDMMIIDTLIM